MGQIADAIYALKMKNIAVVGMSREPSKPAHFVPKYLKKMGYKIIPVNPTAREILGEKCYRSLRDVKERVDVVNIFRPSSEAPQIVRDAILKKAKVVWMQEGISSEEAAEEARKHGIKVIMDKCIMKEFKKFSS